MNHSAFHPLARRSLLAALLLLSTACATSPQQPPTTSPSTMKAVRIHDYGDLDTLRYEDVPRPSPQPDEVLIRVHAAGINPVDAAIRAGRLKDRLPHPMPLTLGWDVSGVVEQVGSQVTRFKQGDAVYAYPGLRRSGGYAEYIVVREQDAALKPQKLDHIHAAGVPLTALTAWQALFDHAKLTEGQTVLIHGGAGGVGTMAIQLAKIKGAKVIATGSAHNLEHLKSLGADQVIDYTATRFEDVAKDVDVVLDPIGGDTQQRSFKVLKKGGFLVALVQQPSEETARAHGVQAMYFVVQPNSEELAEITRLIDAGRIKTVISEVLPLRDARRAHELIQTRHTRGKIVLRVVE